MHKYSHTVKNNSLSFIPPPFSNTRFGKRQTFPNPTAYPTHERMKSNLFPHCSRSTCSPSSSLSSLNTNFNYTLLRGQTLQVKLHNKIIGIDLNCKKNYWVKLASVSLNTSIVTTNT